MFQKQEEGPLFWGPVSYHGDAEASRVAESLQELQQEKDLDVDNRVHEAGLSERLVAVGGRGQQREHKRVKGLLLQTIQAGCPTHTGNELLDLQGGGSEQLM